MERVILLPDFVRASLRLSMLPVYSKYLSQAELLVVVKKLDNGDKFFLVMSSPSFPFMDLWALKQRALIEISL